MKTIIASVVALSVLAMAGAAGAHPHRGHKVCHWRHHHRVCHWVR
jgi:hypothetical protein